LWNSLFAATEERERREKREGRNSSEKTLALCRKGHTPTHTYTEFKKQNNGCLRR
jgi:3-mercaptopyruvate sulfurtransferase SseA